MNKTQWPTCGRGASVSVCEDLTKSLKTPISCNVAGSILHVLGKNSDTQLQATAPLEFFFQEQSYSSLHSEQSLAWDHVRGDIDDPCGAIADFSPNYRRFLRSYRRSLRRCRDPRGDRRAPMRRRRSLQSYPLWFWGIRIQPTFAVVRVVKGD